MLVREALREVRHPGRVYGQVLVREGVRWVQLVKADVVWQLEQARDRDERSPWVVERADGGDLYLSVED